ncbi:hypothetical protein VNI00_006541 [Paramarasmius palmivorus]|uniref:N-acetyltransferase domain-containing protein n=1 Tax=Paramarasmius palmivorus TaxID=297713 RepID=A0AAW0D942_9AGAR
MLSSEKDTNFCFPIPDILETDGVRLVPFIPSKHASPLLTGLNNTPDLTQHVNIGPFTSPSDLVQNFWEKSIKPNPNYTLFVIYDKIASQPPSTDENANAAGFIALSGCSTEHLLAEIGIVTFKAYQGTHVSSHAVGLLMRYALDLPDQGGLGLRRVQWQTNQVNKASVGLALKMGFIKEGVLRWHKVLEPGKEIGHNGGKVRRGDPQEGCGARDTVILAVCWDDWEDGVRKKVERMLSAKR